MFRQTLESGPKIKEEAAEDSTSSLTSSNLDSVDIDEQLLNEQEDAHQPKENKEDKVVQIMVESPGESIPDDTIMS